MAEKKYLILPGFVKSRNDGQRHFISAGQLMRLYKVHPSECIVWTQEGAAEGYPEHLRRLAPRYSGDYQL